MIVWLTLNSRVASVRGPLVVRYHFATHDHADGLFRLRAGNRVLAARHLVIATGGPSIPKMGATGFAYDQAISLGLPLANLPAIGWFARTIGVAGPDGKPIPYNGFGQLPWVTVDGSGSRFVDENRTGSVSNSGIMGTHENVWNLTTRELLERGVPPDALPYLDAADASQFVCSKIGRAHV